MKYKKIIFFTILILGSCNQNRKEIANNKENILEEGYWMGNLTVQNNDIPFIFYIDSNQNISVYNDKDTLKMKEIHFVNDSAKVYFNAFPTYLKFKINANKNIAGYFVNPDHKKPNIKLQANYVSDTLFNLYKKPLQNNTIPGKWEVKFKSNTDHPYYSLGQFYQADNSIKGTFLKNSGDEGFLSGTFYNDTLKLYSFNGSSAGLFIAELKNDTMKGLVLSGNSGETHWMAYKNENFELENKDSITYMVKDSLHLHFKTLNGDDFTFPNENTKGKVIILEIMGTWCPNCLDETRFLKELYKKYHTKGIEIIGIAYERPELFEDQVKRVKRYIESENISYPIVIGGNSSDGKVIKDFSMLNNITAFPTAIYIDKSGKIAKIYTGFSGPGTGIVYDKYKSETTRFIEDLLTQ